jgi:hypothetical protein
MLEVTTLLTIFNLRFPPSFSHWCGQRQSLKAVGQEATRLRTFSEKFILPE